MTEQALPRSANNADQPRESRRGKWKPTRTPTMAVSTQARPLSKRETSNLIGSDKVEGTPVYRPNGDRVGQIERIMIDKLGGKVACAVMRFGGFFIHCRGPSSRITPPLRVMRSTPQNNS